MNKKDMDEEVKQEYLIKIMTSKDPEVLREMLFTSLTVVDHLYRKVQINLMIQPVIFLAGFLTCYFLFL
jgi:hypothetical protein